MSSAVRKGFIALSIWKSVGNLEVFSKQIFIDRSNLTSVSDRISSTSLR